MHSRDLLHGVDFCKLFGLILAFHNSDFTELEINRISLTEANNSSRWLADQISVQDKLQVFRVSLLIAFHHNAFYIFIIK